MAKARSMLCRCYERVVIVEACKISKATPKASRGHVSIDADCRVDRCTLNAPIGVESCCVWTTGLTIRYATPIQNSAGCIHKAYYVAIYQICVDFSKQTSQKDALQILVVCVQEIVACYRPVKHAILELTLVFWKENWAWEIPICLSIFCSF